MNNARILWGGIIVAVVAIIGGYFYPGGSSTIVNSFGAASPTGSTFNNAKIAMATVDLSAVAGTSTAILNGDVSDRIVSEGLFDCNTVGTSRTFSTGAGLSALTFTISTSSSATNNTNVNTNYILQTDVATTSTELYSASGTPGLTGTAAIRRWATGSYLIIGSNATNTANCTIGVKYFGT